MPKLSSYILAFALLLVSVSANDLIFVNGAACNLSLAHTQCEAAAQGRCCVIDAPFCGKLFCRNCQTGNDLYSFDKRSCKGESKGACREKGRGSLCCLDLGGGKGCAGQWNTGGARQRRTIMGASGRQVSEEECEVVVHPNKMVYTDDKGKRWEIYMPARDVYKALDHFRKEEWDELAKFPKWEGQRYTDADNLKNIADLKSFYSVPSLYDDEDDGDTETADASKGNDAQEEESGGKENDAKENNANDKK